MLHAAIFNAVIAAQQWRATKPASPHSKPTLHSASSASCRHFQRRIRRATMSNEIGEPPFKKIRSSASELAFLPAEIWGRAATFLELKFDSSEVHALLLALGPLKDRAMSRTIKHWCLKDNVAYLRDYLHDYPYEHSNQEIVKIASSLRDWMDLNPDWKRALNPYGSDEKNALSDQFITDNTFDLQAVSNNESDVLTAFSSEVLTACAMESGSGHMTVNEEDVDFLALDEPVTLFEVPFIVGSVIVGIDGVDVRAMRYNEVYDMLEQKLAQKKRSKIKVMPECIVFFFLNPAAAIDFGLFDVLRFIVEDVGVDCSREFCGIHFDSDEFWSVPLITHGLAQPDPRFFDYLLSLNDVKPNPIVHLDFDDDADDDSGPTLLHMMGSYNPIFEGLQKSIGPSVLIQRLESLLQHNKVDVDVENENGRTTLFCLFRRLNKLKFDYRSHVLSNKDGKQKFYRYKEIELHVVKAFLDAGASTDSVNVNVLPDREGYRGTMSALIEADDKAARNAIIASLDSQEN